MKKVIWTVVVIVVLLVIGAIGFYRSIQGDFSAANERAEQIALNESSLVRADRVVAFVGDEAYRIVFGVNADDEQMLVWVGNNEIHEELEADGITEEEVKAWVRQRHGKVQFRRVVPGKYEEDYAWEAYFAKEESSGSRFYYEYYRFHDGKRLDTYRINGE